jgi:hypothetical protein
MSSQPNEQRLRCSREQFQNEEEPNRGSSSPPVQIHYTQPTLLPPQASCSAWPEPLRTMLVDGTAASETIASAEAISFFVFDI